MATFPKISDRLALEEILGFQECFYTEKEEGRADRLPARLTSIAGPLSAIFRIAFQQTQEPKAFTFAELQRAQAAWAAHNFGPSAPGDGFERAGRTLHGVTEEIGELDEADAAVEAHTRELVRALGRLAHAHLKQSQKIRLNEDHAARAQDAVADIIIYLVDYCERRGWDMGAIVERVWRQVQQRDWKKNPTTAAEVA